MFTRPFVVPEMMSAAQFIELLENDPEFEKEVFGEPSSDEEWRAFVNS